MNSIFPFVICRLRKPTLTWQETICPNWENYLQSYLFSNGSLVFIIEKERIVAFVVMWLLWDILFSPVLTFHTLVHTAPSPPKQIWLSSSHWLIFCFLTLHLISLTLTDTLTYFTLTFNEEYACLLFWLVSLYTSFKNDNPSLQLSPYFNSHFICSYSLKNLWQWKR